MTYENLYSAAMDVIKTNNLQSTSRPNDSVCLILTSKDTIYTGVSYNTLTDGNPTEKSAERAALNNMLSGGELIVSALITVNISSLQPLYPNKEVLGLIRTTNPENSKCMVCMPNKLYHPLMEAIGMIPDIQPQNADPAAAYSNNTQGMSDQQYMNKMNQYMNNIQQYQNGQYINNTQPYANGQYAPQYPYPNQPYSNQYMNGMNQYQPYPYQPMYPNQYPNGYQQQYSNYTQNGTQNTNYIQSNDIKTQGNKEQNSGQPLYYHNSKYFSDNNKQTNTNTTSSQYYQPNYYQSNNPNQNFVPYNMGGDQTYNGQNYYQQPYSAQMSGQIYQQQAQSSVSIPYQQQAQSSVSIPYQQQAQSSSVSIPMAQSSISLPDQPQETASEDKTNTENSTVNSNENVNKQPDAAADQGKETPESTEKTALENSENTTSAAAENNNAPAPVQTMTPEKKEPEMYGNTKALYPTPKSTILNVPAESKTFDKKENENKLGSADAISGPFDPKIDFFFNDDADSTAVKSSNSNNDKTEEKTSKKTGKKEKNKKDNSKSNTKSKETSVSDNTEAKAETNLNDSEKSNDKSENRNIDSDKAAETEKASDVENTDKSASISPSEKDDINTPTESTESEKSEPNTETEASEQTTNVEIKTLDNPIFTQPANSVQKKAHKNNFFKNLFKQQ